MYVCSGWRVATSFLPLPTPHVTDPQHIVASYA